MRKGGEAASRARSAIRTQASAAQIPGLEYQWVSVWYDASAYNVLRPRRLVKIQPRPDRSESRFGLFVRLGGMDDSPMLLQETAEALGFGEVSGWNFSVPKSVINKQKS